MFSKPPREKEWVSWLYVALWMLVIYLTIPFARILQTAVRDTWGKEVFTSVVLAATVIGIGMMALYAVRHGPWRSWGGLVWLLGVGVIYVYYTSRLRTSPEEALHFIEYGVLGIFLFRALEHRVRDPLIYVSATAIGFLLGTIDEVIQWITPDRFWDLRDVWMNGFSVIMIQLAIAKGLRPSVINLKVSPASVRILANTVMAELILLALCLSNTPAVVKWYSDRLPGISFLQHSKSMMVEYGFAHADPEIGVFSSRFDLDELEKQDAERGREVARILDDWTDPRKYGEFLEKYSPVFDPFTHEARVHLFRRDHYIAVLPKYADNAEGEALHAKVAHREDLIMRKYFSNTLYHSSYELPARKRTFIQLKDSGGPYVSAVSRGLITRYRPVHIWSFAAILCFLISVGRYWGIRRIGQRDHAESERV